MPRAAPFLGIAGSTAAPNGFSAGHYLDVYIIDGKWPGNHAPAVSGCSMPPKPCCASAASPAPASSRWWRAAGRRMVKSITFSAGQNAARRRSAADPRRQGAGVAPGILEDKAEPLPERFRRLFRTAASGFDRAGANTSCAIGAVALDLDARDEALLTVCRDAMDGWIASIAHSSRPDEAVRRSFAEMVVAGVEGAFILSRARQSGTPFITVGEWLATMLEQFPRNAGAVPLGSQCAGGRRYPGSGDRRSECARSYWPP